MSELLNPCDFCATPNEQRPAMCAYCELQQLRARVAELEAEIKLLRLWIATDNDEIKGAREKAEEWKAECDTLRAKVAEQAKEIERWEDMAKSAQHQLLEAAETERELKERIAHFCGATNQVIVAVAELKKV